MAPFLVLVATVNMTLREPTQGREALDDAATLHRVEELEAQGRYARAAKLAETLAAIYPQDYASIVYAGWLRFQAEHYRRAVMNYRGAIALSKGSLESRLGLGWSLVYDGRHRDALAELEALLQANPGSSEVAEALGFARRRPRVAVMPWVSLAGQVYGSSLELNRGFGVRAGLGLRVVEHFAFGVSYGFTTIGYDAQTTDTTTTEDGGDATSLRVRVEGNGGQSGNGSGNGAGYGNMGQSARGSAGAVQGSFVEQHQVHASAGVVWPVAGALLQYGYLWDEGLDDVHAIGLSLRYRRLGDVVFETSITIEPNTVRPRFAPSWKIPIHRQVWIRPEVSLQVDDTEVLAVGVFSLGVDGRVGAVWLGGKYGRERRPAYLSIPIIFNLAGDIRWGGWIGGALNLPAGFGLNAGYELFGIEPAPSEGTVLAHYISLGLSFTTL